MEIFAEINRSLAEIDGALDDCLAEAKEISATLDTINGDLASINRWLIAFCIAGTLLIAFLLVIATAL